MTRRIALPESTDVIVPVWGDRFWSLFVDYALPSHITEGNAETLAILGARWRIFCRPGEYKKFAGSPSMKRLHELFHVDIVDLSSLEDARDTFQYSLMTRCHQKAICEAPQAIIFVNPDQISSTNSYAGVKNIVSHGYRAVMVQGLRLVRERFIDLVRSNTLQLDDLNPQTLCRVSMQILHPLGKAHIVRQGANRSNGSYFWIDPMAGILAHCFHLHPFFYWPSKRGARVGTTIDHEMVRIGLPDRKLVYVVQDSDVVLQCELSPLLHLIDYIDFEPIPMRQAADWAKDWTSRLHRTFFQLPIHFRTSDASCQTRLCEEASDFAGNFLEILQREHGGIIGSDMLVTRDLYRQQGEIVSDMITSGI